VTNNDIMRRIRYAFDFDDSKMIALFAQADFKVSRQQISAWLKKDDNPAFVECSESELALFLDGLINDRRGRREGPQPAPDLRLNNNIIFRKLRIALNLRDEDILVLLNLGGFPITKPELNALFRKPDNRHFRVCKDQILRHFIRGVQLKYRPGKAAKKPVKKEPETDPKKPPIEGFKWK
jgi:uncharacterized protein YehS (DUF1456 family)